MDTNPSTNILENTSKSKNIASKQKRMLPKEGLIKNRKLKEIRKRKEGRNQILQIRNNKKVNLTLFQLLMNIRYVILRMSLMETINQYMVKRLMMRLLRH